MTPHAAGPARVIALHDAAGRIATVISAPDGAPPVSVAAPAGLVATDVDVSSLESSGGATPDVLQQVVETCHIGADRTPAGARLRRSAVE